MKKIIKFVIFSFMYFITGCTGDSEPLKDKQGFTPGNTLDGSCLAPCTIEVRWSPNRESGVNREGGGYRIYYHTEPNFDITRAQIIEVPYSSGPKAPTSKSLTLDEKGIYFLKITAYSGQNPSGSFGSREISFKVE